MKKIIATALTIAMITAGSAALAAPGDMQGGPRGGNQMERREMRSEERQSGGRQEQRQAPTGENQSNGSREQRQVPTREDQSNGSREQRQAPVGEGQSNDSREQRQAPTGESQSDGQQEQRQAPAGEGQSDDSREQRQAPAGEGQSNESREQQAPTGENQSDDRQAPTGENQSNGRQALTMESPFDNQQQASAEGNPADTSDEGQRQIPSGDNPFNMSDVSMNGHEQGSTGDVDQAQKPGNDGQMPGNGNQIDMQQNQMPGNGKQGRMPGAGGSNQSSDRERDQRIDFDSLADSSVISRETCDSIKAYMEGNKPGEGEQTAVTNYGKPLSLLDELLYTKVITAQEYEAIRAASKTGNREADADGQQNVQMDSPMPGDGQQNGQINSTGQGNGQQINRQDGQTPPTMPGDGQQNGEMNPTMSGNGQQNNRQDGQTTPTMPGESQQNNQQGGQTPPTMPGDSQQQASGMNGGSAPGMVDFATLVTDGVISQETGESIKAYMDSHKPNEGDTATAGQASGERADLISELLSEGVISEDEYAIINAARTATGNEMPGQMSGGMPGQMPGGVPGQMPGGMPGDNANVAYSAAATVTGSSDGSTYASSADDENAVLVSGNDAALTHTTITKTGSSSGESADFNGTNAAVLATGGATLSISDTSVTTDGAHANGVFSYGSGTTVNVSNTTIETTGNNSGGLMTTGGATMNASDLTVSTRGNSSAAIRSDRGGGTVNVTRGAYSTAGVGSPAIYSTADITVSDATLSADNSEAVVIEGGNSVTLENVNITGDNATLNGQSTRSTNVLIYQSMSGDASEGSSSFTMTGGTMTALTGSMFHVTNVTTTINLENVDFSYSADSDVFLDASADAWGSSGRNGGNVTLNLVDQDITGAILSDAASSVTVNLDENSTWSLTGDSYVAAINGDMSRVNTNGYTLYISGVAVA